MQFSGRSLRRWAAGVAIVGFALAVAACGGGSSGGGSAPKSTAPSRPASSAPVASGGNAADAAACKTLHPKAVSFAQNVKTAADSASRAAAYGGYVVGVEEAQHNTENTPLLTPLNVLASALQAQANAEAGGGNPSNAAVVKAASAVYTLCKGYDPTENW